MERLLFLKTWFNTKHSYITFNFGDVIVLMARQIDLKSAYNHYGEETRSYYETCEGLFASPVMQRKCDFDDKQFAVFVLLVEHVSIRSLGRFCWGRLGENMFFLTPEDPMIVFASLHVLDCIGLEHLVLFSSRSAFHFDLTDPILRPLLYLWLRIFSGIMTGNTYVVSTQQGWITEMFSSQVKPASLTAHFVLQATLSFFKSVVNVWDGTEVPTSCHHQLFVISKCANLCVKRGKYELYNSWDFFLSIVVSYTRPLVKLFEVKLVKVQKATHFLSLQGGRVSPFDLCMSYVLMGNAKYKFAWPPWIDKKVSSLLCLIATMFLVLFRGSRLQLGSQCGAATRRLRTINLIFMGYSYKGPYFLVLQKDIFGSVLLISAVAEMSYRARKYVMVYGLLFCVFQHLSRGCLRINMVLTYWQALVTPPSLSLLSLFVWLMEAKPEFYRETSDEQILMLAKMVNIFTQR